MEQNPDNRARREQELFSEALELGSPAEQEAFLRGACGTDAALRQSVESLLQAHAQAGGFIPTRLTQAPPDQAKPPLAEETAGLFGRYKLLQKIGEGGCGVVYAAEQQEPVRRRVALKVIKLGMDTKSVIARFEAERQALALMDHPNIAKVLDAGATETGRPYFVMELVRGIRITDYCDQNHLPTRARLELFVQICQAIQHAHQKGVIHRDIKPSNILVTLHDGVPVPKVIDFGIAKATTDQRLTDRTLYTALEQFVGTPAYMSPEQAEMSGLDIDTRSDVYSLGVLLYELLTGKTPFDSQALLSVGLDAMRQTIRESEPERPSTRLSTMLGADLSSAAKHRQTEPSALVSEIRGDLDWIVMRCLEKDRTRRYETANGLAMDIKRYVEGQPVLARPPSTVYLMQKFVRRNRLKVAAATAILGTLVIGGVVSTWQASVARRMARREAAARQEAQDAGALATAAEQRAVANLVLARENASQAARFLYDADINLAQRALQSDHLGLARRLLARHAPEGSAGRRSLPESFSFGAEQRPSSLGESTNDLRGWEWRYLWQQCQSAAVRLCKLARGITGLSFAPDGDRLVATMLGGQTAELWSRLQGQRLQVLTTNGCGAAQSWCTAFSPVAPLLAIGLAKGAVLVTNLDSGAHWTLQTGASIGDWGMMADKLAFSPDGRRLAALGGHWWDTKDRGTLFVWETENFNLVSTTTTSAPIGDGYTQGDLAWMPNSDGLWIGAKDSWIELISALGGLPMERAIADKIENSVALAVSPSGDTLAVSPSGDTLATARTSDPAVRVWHTRNGAPVAPPRQLTGHSAYVSCLAYSPDGRWLASASADQTIQLWDTRTWQPRVLKGHAEEVHALAFTPDSQVLASGSRDGEVLLWDPTALTPARDYQRLPRAVANAVIATGSRQILACMTNESLVLIDSRTLAIVPIPLPFVPARARLWRPGLAVASDGTNRLAFIEVAAQGSRVLGEVAGSQAALEESVYSPEDRVFAFPSATNAVACVPLDDFSRRYHLPAGPGITNVSRLRFRGRQLLGYAASSGILVWDLRQRALVQRLVLQGLNIIPQPELPDLIAFDEGRKAIQFRDPSQPETVRDEIRLPYSIARNWAFSPDYRTMAHSVQDAGSILLIDLPTRSLRCSLQRHRNAVRGPEFSSDGRRLASGGGLGDTVKLWDVETGQELLSLHTQNGLTSSVQFSDDGNLILASGWHLWRAPSWEEIRLAERASETHPAPRAARPVESTTRGTEAAETKEGGL